MIKLSLINFELVEEDKRQAVEELVNQRVQYFNELFKRYPAEVPLELKFQKKPSGWKVDAMIKMQSATLYFEESGKNLQKVVSAIFSKMKNQVKKQKAIERKDYEYKRAKYRKKLLSQKDFEALVDMRARGDRAGFDNLLKGVYDDLHLDIKDNYMARGKSEEEAEKLTAELMEKIKQEIYETFTAGKDQREEFLDSISDISHYFEQQQ